jgi:hypothetical protein
VRCDGHNYTHGQTSANKQTETTKQQDEPPTQASKHGCRGREAANHLLILVVEFDDKR